MKIARNILGLLKQMSLLVIIFVTKMKVQNLDTVPYVLYLDSFLKISAMWLLN